MPEMDGLEATRIIREETSTAVHNPHKYIPIIAVTAHAMEKDLKVYRGGHG